MTKPTWIFVAGTYRSASTTQYRIVRDIVEETGNGIGVGYHTESKLKDFDTPNSGRYVVCKVFKYLPIESKYGKLFVRENRLLATVTIRDPRDIIVSMRTRHDKRQPSGKLDSNPFDFNETATVHMPLWLGQLQKWIDLGPELTLVTRFEDLTANLFGEVNRVAKHLDIDLPRDKAHDIAGCYTIRAIELHKRQVRIDGGKEDPWIPSIPAIVFGTSGIHKTWLNQPERRTVENANKAFMHEWGYL